MLALFPESLEEKRGGGRKKDRRGRQGSVGSCVPAFWVQAEKLLSAAVSLSPALKQPVEGTDGRCFRGERAGEQHSVCLGGPARRSPGRLDEGVELAVPVESLLLCACGVPGGESRGADEAQRLLELCVS